MTQPRQGVMLHFSLCFTRPLLPLLNHLTSRAHSSTHYRLMTHPFSWPWNSRTPWRIGNLQLSMTTLLVARTPNICKNYVQGCRTCQQFKINWSLLNLITNLPPVEGYDSILVVVDQGLLKGVILCPCAKTLTWKGATILLQDNLFKKFGLPDKMISDRDPRFAAHAFQELLKLLNICSNLTTSYHPQSDGVMEWVNQEIEAYLAIYWTSHQRTGYIL